LSDLECVIKTVSEEGLAYPSKVAANKKTGLLTDAFYGRGALLRPGTLRVPRLKALPQTKKKH